MVTSDTSVTPTKKKPKMRKICFTDHNVDEEPQFCSSSSYLAYAKETCPKTDNLIGQVLPANIRFFIFRPRKPSKAPKNRNTFVSSPFNNSTVQRFSWEEKNQHAVLGIACLCDRTYTRRDNVVTACHGHDHDTYTELHVPSNAIHNHHDTNTDVRMQ